MDTYATSDTSDTSDTNLIGNTLGTLPILCVGYSRLHEDALGRSINTRLGSRLPGTVPSIAGKELDRFLATTGSRDHHDTTTGHIFTLVLICILHRFKGGCQPGQA